MRVENNSPEYALLLLIIIISRRRYRANEFDEHNNAVILLSIQFNIIIVYKYRILFLTFFLLFVTFNAILVNAYLNFKVIITKC